MPQRSGGGLGRRGFPSVTRLVVASAVTIIGVLACIDSLANVTARVAPLAAHNMAPWNGRVTSQAAERSFSLKPVADTRSLPARLARTALLQDATASPALTVLGLQAQLRGEPERAREIFAYSLQMSRRQLQARLWSIDSGATRGDLDGVLRDYDLALRTSTQAQEMLYPILTTALGNALIRQRLVAQFQQGAPWSASFLHYAARTRSNPRDVVPFLAELAAARVPVIVEDRLALVDALAETRNHEEAWALYRAVNPSARADQSRDPQFNKGSAPSAIFDWQLGEGASFQQGETQPLLDFSAPASAQGTLLRQAQKLPPGQYVLSGRSARVDQPSGTLPFWLVACADGRELVRVDLMNAPDGDAPFLARFEVPGNCPTQMVSLVARVSDRAGGVSGQILRAEVVPTTDR